MEMLGVASSIAGLFSLAGQCVSGAQTLCTLYCDIVDTSKTVKSFAKDVNDLLRTLMDVQTLLGKIQDQASLLVDDVSLTTLRLQLEDCNNEIGTWIRTAEQAKAASGKGTRGWFKKFWMALDKQSTNNVRADMQKRRLEIAVALSTLGRSLDLRLALTTENVKDRVTEAQATTHSILNLTTDAGEALLRLEAASVAMSNDIGSMRSLFSACSSQSQEENRSPPKSPRWNRGWQCDQWKRLEDLFCPPEDREDGREIQRCSFCGLSFLKSASTSSLQPPSVDLREQHLRVTHKVFSCYDEADLYLDLEIFHEHLETAHSAKLGDWTQTLSQACIVWNTPKRRAEETVSSGMEEIKFNPGNANHRSDPEIEEWENPEPQNSMEALMGTLWNSNLLGQWNSSRDRINRWMLHMLGAETRQADLHQSIYQEQCAGSVDIPNQLWGRLVLKYWFLDEAAVGYDLNAVATQLAQADKAANVNTSLHLSDRPSGTNSDQKQQKREEALKVNSRAEERRKRNRAAQREFRRRREERRQIEIQDQRLVGKSMEESVKRRTEARERVREMRQRHLPEPEGIAFGAEFAERYTNSNPFENAFSIPERPHSARANSLSGSMSSIDEVLSRPR